MLRRATARSADVRAGTFFLALPLLVLCGCGATASRRTAEPIPAPAAVGGAAAARLAADPSLQRLLDPYPSESGPSWLGGDVASSIRLADDRWVWIFGDTLLGTVSDRCAVPLSYCQRSVTGPDAGMIANSAGTMIRSADGFLSPVVKYWRTDQAGAPAPIFSAPGEGFLWPLAGVRAGTILLVVANRHTPESGLLPVGNLLVRVSNPDAPPDAWLYDVQPITGFRAGGDGRALLSWTSALVSIGDFVYVFGSQGVGLEARTVLARLDTREVADPAWQPALQYLQRGATGAPPVWSSALDPDRLHEIEGLPGTSEGTIDFADGVGWYTFQIPALLYEIRLYTASNLLGPWQDHGTVYEIPAVWRATRGRCPEPKGAGEEPAWGEADPACAPVYAAYAPKAHPEFAAPGGYVVSYNVNTWGGGLDAAVQALQTRHGFYVPQLVWGAP